MPGDDGGKGSSVHLVVELALIVGGARFGLGGGSDRRDGKDCREGELHIIFLQLIVAVLLVEVKVKVAEMK